MSKLYLNNASVAALASVLELAEAQNGTGMYSHASFSAWDCVKWDCVVSCNCANCRN